MSFGEKLARGIKKIKSKLIVAIVLWLILVILFVTPLSISLKNNEDFNNGKSQLNFMESINKYIVSPLESVQLAFSESYIDSFFSVLWKFSLFYAIAITIGLAKAMPKHEYDDIEHGSSDWSVMGEQYKVLDKNKGIILAEKNYLPVDKRGNTNVLVVGGSGAGKSASYVIPNACQLLGSYVFTDPKGELYDKTAGFFKAKGYDIKVLNLIRPQNSDGYNPLNHISNDIDVDIIANTVVKGQTHAGGSSDPYWEDMAEMLLKALIYYLKAVRPPEEQNLASCAELVRAANNNGGDNLLTNLMNKLPYDHPARMYYKSIEIAPEKTYGSILSSLQSKLGKFDSREIAELTSTDTIDFKEIGSKKTVVYVISSDTHTAYDFLLTIFFSQMIQQLYDYADTNGGALPVPTYFILDEFANIGKIPDFDKKISTSRSRKISFSVILQNLDQLEAVYEKSHETIMGNCDTHLFLGSNSQKTVEYFSKALGEKTIVRDSVSVNKDRNDWKQGKSESDQIMGRALLTPDELRRLDSDLCIIYEKGIKPIKANKYYYFKYPEGKMLQKYTASHNDVEIERGSWRKFNPYNPYEESVEKGEAVNTKIESLDDLFDDEDEKEEKPKKSKNIIEEENEEFAKIPQIPLDDEEIETRSESNEPEQKEDEELRDIQKELEAKFDELFGALESDD